MKIIIILLICVPSLLAEDNAGDISFKYGFLGQFKSNPDSTVELSDSSIIHTDDEVRINAGYLSRTHFYAVFLSSEGEYMLLYPEDASKEEKSPSDTTYVTALQWNSFIDPAGLETFYLINSEEPQADLEKLFRRYAKAPEKGQAKLGKKIATILNSLDPDKKEGLANLSKRLDKPLVGGVAFRGEEDEKLKDQSLTHTCSGKNGIAFQKITLIHK